MSYFFVIVLFSLCTTMIQATPMMNPEGQKSPDPSSIEQQPISTSTTGLQQIPPQIPPLPIVQNPISTPVQAVPTEHLTPAQLAEDVKKVPCGDCVEKCKCKLEQSDNVEPEKKPEEREHGWGIGIKNAARWIYRVFYTNVLGPKGVLTTLLDPKPKKTNKTKSKNSNSNKSNDKDNGQGPSRVTACCVFYSKHGPPVKDDDDEDGKHEKPEEEETDKETPPVNCFWLFSKNHHQTTTTMPGQSTAVPAVVPGGKSKADNRVFNCFTGSKLINIIKFIKINFLAKFNCCALDVNFNVATMQ